MRSKPSAVLKRLMRELQLCKRHEEFEVVILLRDQCISYLKRNNWLERENRMLREKIKLLEREGCGDDGRNH